MSHLTVAGFFAGIGGIERGLELAGHQTSFMCEVDPSARRILATRFPDIAIHEDIRELKRFPDVDLVAAGFPCQDLSPAGRTAGIHGKKSRLVADVFKLIASKRNKPRWILFENVSFM